jgi:hypothetical protein
MDFAGEEVFQQEDVDTIVKNAISSTLTDVMWDNQIKCVLSLPNGSLCAFVVCVRYNQEKITAQINAIVDSCLKELQSLNRPFK